MNEPLPTSQSTNCHCVVTILGIHTSPFWILAQMAILIQDVCGYPNFIQANAKTVPWNRLWPPVSGQLFILTPMYLKKYH